MLKILFAGTPDVAVPSLRALAADSEHFEVVAVLRDNGRTLCRDDVGDLVRRRLRGSKEV